MNAKERKRLIGAIETYLPLEYRDPILRALRLLAAAEANDGGIPEMTKAVQEGRGIELGCQFERERSGLAARVEELEPDAERYRFLKDGLWDDYRTGVIEMRKNAIWDAAIDAARSKP